MRGALAAIPIAILANLAIAIIPHVRGIEFVPALRFAIVTPACAIAAVLAVLAHRRGMLRIALAIMSVAALSLLAAAGLLRAGALAVVTSAIGLAFLVPRWSERPPRTSGMIALAVFGALELAGVMVALRSETAAAPTFVAEHRYMDIDGARVHYVDEGSGPTLLFLHGNPAWSFQWRTLIAGLRGRYRCIAPDYPGFGLSTAPAGYRFTPREQSVIVEKFVDRLALRDVTLVMQDWGGPIGLGMAGRRPELVRRVVLGNTWAWPTSTTEPRGKFSLLVGGPIGEFAQMNFNAFAHAAVPVAEYAAPFRPLERRGVAAFYPGQITAASAYMNEVEAGLSRLRDRPALIVWGTRDPGMPPPDREKFERAFPDHRTILLPNGGHFFFEDAPQTVIDAIAAFVPET